MNEYGLPVEGGNLVVSARCYIEVSSESKSGRNEDGVYPVGSYVVSLDYDAVSSDFAPTKIQLVHERKGDLGVFTIQRMEFYNITRTIQIWI